MTTAAILEAIERVCASVRAEGVAPQRHSSARPVIRAMETVTLEVRTLMERWHAEVRSTSLPEALPVQLLPVTGTESDTAHIQMVRRFADPSVRHGLGNGVLKALVGLARPALAKRAEGAWVLGSVPLVQPAGMALLRGEPVMDWVGILPAADAAVVVLGGHHLRWRRGAVTEGGARLENLRVCFTQSLRSALDVRDVRVSRVYWLVLTRYAHSVPVRWVQAAFGDLARALMPMLEDSAYVQGRANLTRWLLELWCGPMRGMDMMEYAELRRELGGDDLGALKRAMSLNQFDADDDRMLRRLLELWF